MVTAVSVNQDISVITAKRISTSVTRLLVRTEEIVLTKSMTTSVTALRGLEDIVARTANTVQRVKIVT